MSLSLSRSTTAYLHYLTPLDSSLTIIPIPQSITNRHITHITYYLTGTTVAASGLGGLGADITGYFDALQALPSLSTQTPVALGILWTGAVSMALTIFLQTVGQRTVSGTTANVIYSSQPVWSSMISYLFLHESVSAADVAGAVLLCAAVLIAATDTDTQAQAQQEEQQRPELLGSERGNS